MLNTVLFDMGGTLEDIWNNQETQAKAMDALQKTLRAHGLEPGCSPEEFDRRVMAGLKEYKRWSEGLELEKKPEEIWPDYYLKEFGFDREKLIPITEELANLWEVTYYHRELRGDVLETLEALKARGYHIGIISNNASLYNVFNMLEEYGIRGCMEDVTVSSVTGYRKPHPEIFRISLRQMQTTAENCVYVGDTISRDIIGAKQAGFGKAVQIVSALSAQKDAATAADAEKPDLVLQNDVERTPLELVEEIEGALYPNIVEHPIDNTDYWNLYYQNKLCPTSPSPFARYVSTLVEPGRTLAELGCGNGRDALYFASLGLDVVAMDLSEAAIGMLRQQPVPHARFVCGDFVSHTLHQPESYDYAYSRFTIHAINQKQERMLLGSMARALKPGGKFFIEVRSVHDPLYGKGEALERNAFFYDNHYRRFLVLDELTEALRQAGFRIEYAREQTGFAPYGNDDPPVIRVVAVKN